MDITDLAPCFIRLFGPMDLSENMLPGTAKTRRFWPRALLAGESAEVRARLLRGGLYVSTARRAREGLATYLMRSRPAARVRIVARLGWHDAPGGRVFVLPRETIGADGAEPVLTLGTIVPMILNPYRSAK